MDRSDTGSDHDELLAQLGWMRTLARRLTRDPDVADDVLQGACLLALQKPPEPQGGVGGLRAWMAAVLRRMASDRRRDQARRDAREQLAAAPEELPATIDLAARREILRALVDALTTLEEPGFSTVVRRYYEGLSTLQIASQDGVSPEVVRQRLQRARTRLRERLTSTLDPRWLPALALLSPRIGEVVSRIAGAAPHGASLPQSLLRGLLMAERTSRPLVWKVALAAITLALGAGTWSLVRQRHDEAPATSTALVPRLTAAAAAPERPTPLQSEIEQLDAPAALTTPSRASPNFAALAPRVVLTGRLVDQRGTPIAEAEVIHVPSPGLIKALNWKPIPFGPSLPWGNFVRTRSDAEGRFRLETNELPQPDEPAGQPPEELYQIPREPVPALAVLHPDFEARLQACSAYAEGDFDVGDIVLRPGLSITGRAVDDRGAPVSGVIVRMDYHYSSISAPGPDLARELEWEVLDEAIACTSGEDGHFRLGSLWSGTLPLHFEHPRYAPLARNVDLADASLDLGDVVLTLGGAIAGIVLDDEGHPLAGATVRARPTEVELTQGATDTAAFEFSVVARADNAHEVEARTDAQGAFELLTLNQPTYTVLAGADGFEPAKLAGVEVGRRDVQVQLLPQAWALVTVRDARSGEPVEGAAATGRRYAVGGALPGFITTRLDVLAGEPAAAAARAVLGENAPGPTGLLVVRGLGQGRNLLAVTAGGYATTAVDLPSALPGERIDQEARLARESVVIGRVVDGTGATIAGAEVLAARAGTEKQSGNPRTETADTEGRFRVSGLSEGEWTFMASAPTFARGEPRRVELAAEQVLDDLVLELEKGGVIRGVIYDIEGSPQSQVGVELRRTVPPGRVGKAATASGDDGRFTAANLPGGTYEVTARQAEVVTVELPSGGETQVELHLRALPVIVGRVVDGDGPVAHAKVTLEARHLSDDGWSIEEDVETDAAGRYHLTPQSAGSYRLRATISSTSTPVVQFDLAWGEQRLVDLSFGTGRIGGVVIDAATGQPMAKAQVGFTPRDADGTSHADDRSAVVAVVRTDGDGRFNARRLEPGQYDVSAWAHLFQKVTREDVPVPGGDELRFELPPAALLELTVVSSNGLDVPFDIQLVPRSTGSPGSVLPMQVESEGFSAAGRVWRANLPPGTCRLQVVQPIHAASGLASSRVLAEMDATLVAGKELKLQIAIAP